MELPIEELLEKYWKGETSLDEERRIKQHFWSNPAPNRTSGYFRGLKKQQEVAFRSKKPNEARRRWLSVAAMVAVGVFTALLVLRESRKDPFAIEDPQHALEITRKTLLMLGTQLNEGQSYALEITKINKAKDELETPEEL